MPLAEKFKLQRLRFVRQQIQCDGRADNLLHVRADDRNFDHDPQHETRKRLVLAIAHFGEMQSRDDSQSKTEENKTK